MLVTLLKGSKALLGIGWWIAGIAAKVLSMPTSSATSEQNWSTKGFIPSRVRDDLTSQLAISLRSSNVAYLPSTITMSKRMQRMNSIVATVNRDIGILI